MDAKYDEALAILEQLLLKDPDNSVIFEEIADNELSLEHYDRALAAAQRAIVLDPESYTGHYILGFLASHREEWEVSVTELKLANHYKPNNPEILRCLGWALYSKGEPAMGLVTLERALNLDADNTLTLCDLGVAYVQGQNFRKARALFQRAIDLEPENGRALDCLQMVDRIQKHLASAENE